MKTKTIFESTKSVLSSAADIVVTASVTTSDLVKVGGATIASNLKLMHLETIRDNNIENASGIDEALDVVDSNLDRLESITIDGLSERQAKRLQLRLAMWDHVASVVESTKTL